MKAYGILGAAAALLLGLASSCAKNPMGPAPSGGLTNGTTFFATVEELTNDVLFSPQTGSETLTRTPVFGGPIFYSWGGTSKTGIGASGGTPVTSAVATGYGTTSAPPTNDILLYSPGIGGPTGTYTNDYYLSWKGYKGPDASLDYSSMTYFFAGNQVNFDLKSTNYRGFIMFVRGTGNFYVSLSAGNPGDGQAGPYKGYNFYTYGFGDQISASQWRQVTVLFSDMEQLYGASVDINNVMAKSWGLQFEQQPPVTADFQLDLDYIRFFK